MCTFENSADAGVCEICGHVRFSELVASSCDAATAVLNDNGACQSLASSSPPPLRKASPPSSREDSPRRKPALCRHMSEPVECVICLENLSDQRPVCVLVAKGHRACRNLMHEACARELMAGGHSSCPECRADFEDIRVLPPLSEPDRWFEAMDDGSGRLTKQCLLDALAATCPLGRSELETVLEAAGWDWSKPIDAASFRQVIAPWLGAVPETGRGTGSGDPAPMGPLEHLAAMFPQRTEEELRLALSLQGDDVEGAAEALLAGSMHAERQAHGATPGNGPTREAVS